VDLFGNQRLALLMLGGERAFRALVRRQQEGEQAGEGLMIRAGDHS
jgi:hypothetical protein